MNDSEFINVGSIVEFHSINLGFLQVKPSYDPRSKPRDVKMQTQPELHSRAHIKIRTIQNKQLPHTWSNPIS